MIEEIEVIDNNQVLKTTYIATKGYELVFDIYSKFYIYIYEKNIITEKVSLIAYLYKYSITNIKRKEE